MNHLEHDRWDIEKIIMSEPVVYQLYLHSKEKNWSYEKFLTECVVYLAERNKQVLNNAVLQGIVND